MRSTDTTTDRLNKVAAITGTFWVLKILATTLGETTGDFFSMSMGLGYYTSFGITFVALAFIIAAQVRARRFHSPLFWLAIVATTTFGTEVSDMMDRSFGLGYTAGSTILVAGLLATLGIWWLRERGLSVYPIVAIDSEVLFWVAVVFSNSLGTAFGDWLSDSVGLGYVEGAWVTVGVIGIVLLLHYATSLSEVLLFWVAFIFTRPFGATFGDFLTKPVAHGGLHLPRWTASGVAFALMAAIILFTRSRAEDGRAAEPLDEREAALE